MRFPIGLKIFGIAVGLLILMAAAALLSLRMTRTVDSQLAIIDQNYFPAYVALAQANIRSVEETAYVRRLLLAIAEPGDNAAKLDQLRQQVATTGKTSDERIADARRYIDRQIAIRSILTTTSRWPGWTTRSRTCRRTGGVTRGSSANCSAPPRRATNRWPANCSANWTICATISTARSTPPATR